MTAQLLDDQLNVPDDRTAAQAAAAVSELGRFMSESPNLADAVVKLKADDNNAELELAGEALRLLTTFSLRLRTVTL